MTKHQRRMRLARRLCKLMGWEYKTCHVYTGIRKVAMAEAVAVGVDKLEEICARLERGRETIAEDRPLPEVSRSSH